MAGWLVDDGIERLASDFWEVDWLLDGFVDKSDDWNVVTTNDFEAESNLFHAGGCWEDSLECVVENEVD